MDNSFIEEKLLPRLKHKTIIDNFVKHFNSVTCKPTKIISDNNR